MMAYQDSNGATVQACRLDAPILVNTVLGEACGSPGEWLVVIPDSKPILMTDEAFNASFTPLE